MYLLPKERAKELQRKILEKNNKDVDRKIEEIRKLNLLKLDKTNKNKPSSNNYLSYGHCKIKYEINPHTINFSSTILKKNY